MSDIANHPLLHLVEAETKSLILQAEEFDRQEAADRQTAAMRIAADAEATIAADANAIEDMDPPLADELGVDISGLGDKRGALERFQPDRNRSLAKMGVPEPP